MNYFWWLETNLQNQTNKKSERKSQFMPTKYNVFFFKCFLLIKQTKKERDKNYV